MYQNQIYMCIFWCSKIFWFPMKKCWCQQKSRDASGDLYFFLDLPYVRYNCAKFHHCRIRVADFREAGPKRPPPTHPWAAPENPILNRVKTLSWRLTHLQLLLIVYLRLWFGIFSTFTWSLSLKETVLNVKSGDQHFRALFVYLCPLFEGSNPFPEFP